MEQIYPLFKSFVDPAFILFVLLIISFFICLVVGKKKREFVLFLIIVLLYGFGIQPVANYLSYQLEKDYILVRPVEEKPLIDVIVVLGGGEYDINALNQSFLCESTVVRLAHAVRMYKVHNAKYLVCSGAGLGKLSDAVLMAQMAEDFGVPRERIRIEAKSYNTYENATEVNKMFVNKDLRIGLVTSAYHMKRSTIEFRKYFNNIVPLPANYLYASPVGPQVVRYVPQSKWLFHNALIFKEYVGRLWYLIRYV